MATPIDILQDNSTNQDMSFNQPSMMSYNEILTSMKKDESPQQMNDPNYDPTEHIQQQYQHQHQHQHQQPPLQFQEQPQSQGNPNLNFIPPPEVQVNNHIYDPPSMTNNPPKPIINNKPKLDFESLQKEGLILLITYIVIHSHSIQMFLSRSIPRMFIDDKLSVIGLLVNAIFLSIAYSVIKHLSISIKM